MKKFISAILVLMLVFTSLFVISTSAAEADDIVHSLLPAADDTNGKVTTNNCEYTCNADGSVTFTVTGAGASVNVVYAEGATVWAGDAFNAKEGAYFVVDYGSADGATLGQNTQAHYTRKDKEAAGTVADLWLTSMEGSDYTQYQKAKGDGYVIWDIGTYISSSDSKVFEDGMHRFTSLELYIEGAVGSSVTVYRFYVGTAEAVEGIGSVRPEAKVPEVSEPDEPAVDVEIPEGAINLGRVPVNTSIVTGSTTVVTDPSIIHNYNVKWTSCALLRPTENENEYSVVATQWLNGDDTFLFADAKEGDIVLSVHGDPAVEGSQANKEALTALPAGSIVTLAGYDFAKLTAADDAVVFFVPAETTPDPETSETPDESSEPADESEEVNESEKADDTSVPAANESEAGEKEESGNTGLIIGIVAGVVAVIAVVVVVVIVLKKKKA